MSKGKKEIVIISFVLSFFLAVALFLVSVSIALNGGFFNISILRKSITESDYVKSVSASLTEELYNSMEERGFPQELVEQILEENDVYILINNNIKKALEGKTVNKEYRHQFENNLSNVLYKYIEEQEVYQTDELKKSVNESVKCIGDSFLKYTYPYLAKEFYGFSVTMAKKVIVIGIVSILVSIICVILLWKIHYFKHRSIRFMTYSIETTVVWNIITMLIIYNSIRHRKGNIPIYYSKLMNEYTNNSMLIGGIVIAVLVAGIFTMVSWGKVLRRKIK